MVKAYINNTGRLEELLYAGAKGYCISKPAGRTEVRLIAVDELRGPALIDTRLQEEGFAKAVEKSLIPWLRGYRVASRNPRRGNSVFDYLLRSDGGELVVELKSAVLRAGPGGEYAAYPDCRSVRGERHLRELRELALSGARVAVVFITTLYDVRAFTPYDRGDPLIRALLKDLIEAGGVVKAVSFRYLPQRGAVLMWDPDLPVII